QLKQTPPILTAAASSTKPTPPKPAAYLDSKTNITLAAVPNETNTPYVVSVVRQGWGFGGGGAWSGGEKASEGEWCRGSDRSGDE
nr:hypothetical protein [Tanacetum cinerariifolium]